MSSLQFLKTVIFHLIDLSTPFRRARPPWHRQTIEVVQWALVVALIGGPAFVCATVSFGGVFSTGSRPSDQAFNLFCNSAVVIPIILLGVAWPSVAAFLVSPLILRQREHRSWDPVLATPYPRRDILTGVIATSLWGFNALLQFTLVVQLAMAVVTCLHAANLGNINIISLACAVMLPFVFILFVIERIQESALALLMGIAVSYLAQSWSLAATGAVVAGLVLRLAQIWLVVLVALLADARQLSAVFTDTLFMGSTAVMFRFSPAITILAPLAFLALRELVFRALYAWIVREMGSE